MDELIRKVLADILTIMKNSNLSESFHEAVLKRLVSFGYRLKVDDGWVICFSIQSVEQHIKNSCNTISIPHGLTNAAIDMVCGEFLFTKKQTGKLELSDLDLNSAIAQIQEGDTTVHFANGTSDESKFDSLLNYLLHSKDGELICFRKLRW